MTATEEPCLAWTAVSIAFRLTPVRDLTEAEIAAQLGVTAQGSDPRAAKLREI